MARKKNPGGEPTRAELEILQILWKSGPSTVRFVNDELNKKNNVAYTSTLKIMQLMHEKRLVLRDSSAMTHIYFAAIKEDVTKKAMLIRFVDSVFEGSSSRLMMQLLGGKKPNKDELAMLKQLVKKFDD